MSSNGQPADTRDGRNGDKSRLLHVVDILHSSISDVLDVSRFPGFGEAPPRRTLSIEIVASKGVLTTFQTGGSNERISSDSLKQLSLHQPLGDIQPQYLCSDLTNRRLRFDDRTSQAEMIFPVVHSRIEEPYEHAFGR